MGICTGCLPLVVGAGAGGTIIAAQRKGVSGVVSDATIRAQIRKQWLQSSYPLLRHLSLSVEDGCAVITGRIPSIDMALEACKLVLNVQGIRSVHDHTEVSEQDRSFSCYLCDISITSRLRTQVLMDRHLASFSYGFRTYDRVVYIMGIARTSDELHRVIAYAKGISRVRKVVNYAQVAPQ